MIRGLRVGNFKAFKHPQYIPISPLTLLYGANSSGKSSILHALLLLCTAAQNGGDFDVHESLLGGNSVDLGGFKNYVSDHDIESTVLIGVDIDPETRPWIRNFIQDSPISLTFEIAFNHDHASDIRGARAVAISVGWEEEWICLRYQKSDSLKTAGVWSVESIDVQHVASKWCVKKAWEMANVECEESEESELENYSLSCLSDLSIHETKIVMNGLNFTGGVHASFARSRHQLFPDMVIDDAADRLKGLMNHDDVYQFEGNKNSYDGWGVPYWKTLLEASIPASIGDLLNTITGLLYETLDTVRYLGPIRSFPPRRIVTIRPNEPNWAAGGGAAWAMLVRNQEVQDEVNRWLGAEFMGMRYQVATRRLVDVKLVRDAMERVLNKGNISRLNSRKSPAEQEEILEAIDDVAATSDNLELVLVAETGVPVTHRDVGFGISQVLPILVSSLAERGALIGIEQPEIHLHPKLQAELAEVFLRAALRRGEVEGHPRKKARNLFILETHSEHMLLRLMKLMRQTAEGRLPIVQEFDKVNPEDVTVLYVVSAHGSDGAYVLNIELDVNGDLISEWPNGFFEEGYNERFG